MTIGSGAAVDFETGDGVVVSSEGGGGGVKRNLRGTKSGLALGLGRGLKDRGGLSGLILSGLVLSGLWVSGGGGGGSSVSGLGCSGFSIPSDRSV